MRTISEINYLIRDCQKELDYYNTKEQNYSTKITMLKHWNSNLSHLVIEKQKTLSIKIG